MTPADDRTTGDPVGDFKAITTIRLADSQDESKWNQYVEANPEGTFFHQFGWKHIIGGHLGHSTYFLLAEAKGRVVGLLPLAHVKSLLFGNALISLPFLVYGGPIGDSPEVIDSLVDHAKELAENLNVDYLELRNRKLLLAGLPTKTSYVTFRKPISDDSEENLKAIPRKQRAMVRKAMKFDLRSEQDADVSRLFRVLSECKRNLGTPFFGQDYLSQVMNVFRSQCEVITITRHKEPLCSVMNFRFRDEILPYYGGGTASARTYAGNDFMYWQVMESARKSGCKIFDYGRSTENTGAYDFKKNWGFVPEPLHYQYYLVNDSSVPNLSPSNRKYQLFIKAWKKLPLWVANFVGPGLARRLG